MAADFKQGTQLAGKTLAAGALASTSATAVYTVPASSAAKVSSFSLTNTSGAAATVTVSVTPSGGSAITIVSAFSLAAGDSTVVSELIGAFLEAAAVITVTAGTAAAITYYITGAVSS